MTLSGNLPPASASALGHKSAQQQKESSIVPLADPSNAAAIPMSPSCSPTPQNKPVPRQHSSLSSSSTTSTATSSALGSLASSVNPSPLIPTQSLHPKKLEAQATATTSNPSSVVSPIMMRRATLSGVVPGASASGASPSPVAGQSPTPPKVTSVPLHRTRRQSIDEAPVLIPYFDPVTDSGYSSRSGTPVMHKRHPEAQGAQGLPGHARRHSISVSTSHQSSYSTLNNGSKTPVLNHRQSPSLQASANMTLPGDQAGSNSARGSETPTRLGPAQLAKQAIMQRRVSISQIDSVHRQSPTSLARQMSSLALPSGHFDLAHSCDDAQAVWRHYSRLTKQHHTPRDSDSVTLEKFNIDNDKIYTKSSAADDAGLRALSSHQVRQLATDLHTYYATQLRCMAAIEHPKFTTEQVEDCVSRHLKASFDDKKESALQIAQIERLIRSNLSTKSSVFDSASDSAAARAQPIEKLHFRQHWDKFIAAYFDVDAESKKLKDASLQCCVM